MFDRFIILFLCAIALVSGCTSGSNVELADTVLMGGKVYTVDASNSVHESIAIKGNKIIAVGDAASVAAHISDATGVIDLEGRFLMPGIIDAHMHGLGEYANREGRLVFDVTDEIDAVLEKIRAWGDSHPDDDVIVGGGWGRETQMKAHISQLDAIDAERPILLGSAGGHMLWVNSKAIELGGVPEDAPDVPGGTIYRDDDGKMIGLFLDASRVPFRPLYASVNTDAPDAETVLKAGVRFSDDLAAYGITGIKNAGARQSTVETYRGLDNAGGLHQRVLVSIGFSPISEPERQDAARVLMSAREEYRSEHVAPDSVKIFVDGIPGSMALLNPVPGNEGEANELQIPQDTLNAAVAELDAMGLSVMMHCNGDKAIRSALDAIAYARETNGNSDIPHQIAHCAIPHEGDQVRFSPLNAICENSPSVWFDHPAMRAAGGFLGEDIVARAYPTRQILEAGGHYAAGSDWLTEEPTFNPWPYIEALVTRKHPYNPERYSGIFNPDHSVDLETALRIYTFHNAYAMLMQDEIGSLEVGKMADMIVLSDDPFEIHIDDVSNITVDMTVFDGEVVYRASERN